MTNEKSAQYWANFYDARARRNTAGSFMRALGYHPADGEDYDGLFKRLFGHSEQSLDLDADHDVLDIACGYGVMTRLLGKRTAGAIGTDLTKVLLEKGAVLAQEEDLPQARGFLQANAVAQPFPDASFDRVLCYGMFFHLDRASAETVVAEVQRLLRPGGKALFGDVLHPGRMHYERSYLAKVPRPLYPVLNWALRLKTWMATASGRVVYQAYGPSYFKRRLLPGATCVTMEGMRDGRPNNKSRYDILITLAE